MPVEPILSPWPALLKSTATILMFCHRGLPRASMVNPSRTMFEPRAHGLRIRSPTVRSLSFDGDGLFSFKILFVYFWFFFMVYLKIMLRRKIISLLGFAVFLAAIFVLPNQAFAAFAGGTGTVGDPYQISTCLQLQQATSSLSSNYILNNDIDCSDTVNWNSGAGFVSIGTSTAAKFSGIFNGNGHKITGLYINRPSTDNIGLFGYTAATAQVLRVGVSGINFTGHANIGGLIGYSLGTTSESYAVGNVTTSFNAASAYTAGLIGVNSGKVINCYARGIVTGLGSSGIAGFIASNVSPAAVSNSFASVAVIGNQANGFIYSQSALPTNSFYDLSVAGNIGTNGGAGTSTVNMMTASTFSSWDLSTIWAIDDNRNNGYPYLRNNDTGVDPIVEISNAADLQNIANNPGGRFIQTADIDATSTNSWNSNTGFAPISLFYGRYSGNGFVISGLFMSSTTRDYNGVFGQNRGIVSNMQIADSSFTGKTYVGSVAGYNYGRISQSGLYRVNYPSQVIGNTNIGGLTGYNNAVGTILQSFAVANVSTANNASGAYAGGLIGTNAGTVSDSYARGTVVGLASSGIAGFISNNITPAAVSNSFAAAVVTGSQGAGFIYTGNGADPLNSFCDLNVAGKACNKGTGTTTVALATATTFPSWNLSTIWALDENRNNGYPYLRNNDTGVDPVIEISSVADLQNIANNPGGRFIQTADIDASSTLSWNSGAGFDPIDIFYGHYEGNGFIITNLTINRPADNYVGVLGLNRGIVNNFKIADSSFTGYTYVGSVAGYNAGTLYRSKLYRLNNSSSQVTGHDYVGGLTGYNDSYGILSQSYAVAIVTTAFNSASANVGGLAGLNKGSILNCYARGTVAGLASSGIAGLVANNTSPGVVYNSFAASVINGSNIGTGFMYSASAAPINSFCDLTVAGKGCGFGTGTTTAALKILTTFTDVGWDFSSGNIWHMDPEGLKDDGYPYLNPPILPAIEIWNVSDLQNIAANPDRNYTQMASFDASAASSWNAGAGFAPIVNFTGTYNGNGFVITNLVINRPTEDYVGIFAQNRGVINGLKVADSSFTGRTYVGSVTGYNQGTIYRSQSYRLNNSSNQVTGYAKIGGLAGYNSSIGVVSQSYAISNVSTNFNSAGASVGGLIGYNAGNVTDCYARGAVSGLASSGIAGLIASNISPAVVSNSYAASTITGNLGAGLIYSASIVPSNSFCDTTVAGKGCGFGTGAATAAMKTETTFTNAGWDFATVWGLQPAENEGYPYFLAGAPDYFSLILSYNGQGSSTVNGSPYTVPVSFASGTEVTLLATASSSWTFANWEDNSTNTTRVVVMDGDKSLIATFAENFNLTLSLVGQGSVTVDSSPYVVPVSFASGTVASLVATPSAGWSFVSWSDGSTSTSRTITMTEAKNLTATFSENPVTLALSVVGQGSLTVDDSPYSSPVGFASGTATILVANPSAGWSFASWSDGSTSPNYVLLMNSDKTLTATFTENPVTPTPPVGDTVTATPRRSSGTSIQSRVINLTAMGNYQAAEDLKKQWPQLFPVAPSIPTPLSPSKNNNNNNSFFTQTLSLNSIHSEVKRLQQYLNTHGFVVAQTGPGSPGQETNKFGALTKKALIKFQEKYAKEILSPIGLKKGTGLFGPGTRNKLNQILGQ
jgi:hypothetical protein